MDFEKSQEKQSFTPEQQEALENDRTVSDAKLIKEGARWKLDEQTAEKKNLDITEGQASQLRMEHEGGIVDDLGTFIRMNKRILLSLDSKEVAETKGLKEVLEKSIGKAWIDNYAGKYVLSFIDKDGNFAEFPIDVRKIKSFSAETREGHLTSDTLYSKIFQNLNRLGFKVAQSGEIRDYRIGEALDKRGDAAAKEQQESKDNSFNF